jgi:LacI family transcriptional regulator
MAAVRSSVTIRDVARVAEVHPSTVSRALGVQTRALVNEQTVQRIIRAAAELGYRVNPIARGLKTSRSCTVAVFIPDVTNPLFPPILRGIEDRLDDAGYTALIVNTDNDRDRERSQLDAMCDRQVDGFISATARVDRELLVAAAGRPVVLVNRSLEAAPVSAVAVDDRRGVRLAVEHLVTLGHVRIGHVAGSSSATTGQRRQLGFLESMRAAGLSVPKSHVRPSKAPTEQEGARAGGQLLDRVPGLTAIVAATDLLAVGCYDALESRGLRCPADVSVVGFNDIPLVDRLSPALTTVRVPQRQIGIAAADMLLELLVDSSRPAREVLLAPTLSVRESTAAPCTDRAGR